MYTLLWFHEQPSITDFFSERYVKDGNFKVYMILRGDVIAEDRIGNERSMFVLALSPIAKNQVSRG